MTSTEPPSLPFPRPSVLEIAPMLRALQAEAPINRVRTEAGDEAWLVTRYDEVRALFGDERLGRSHRKPQEAARIHNSALIGGAADNYDTEDTDHAAMRAVLTPCFSARRMRALTPKVEALVDGLLDDLARLGPPANLHEVLSFPLPALVICELLGVPYADRDTFRALSAGMADRRDAQRSAESLRAMTEYMHGLIERKRVDPADDVLSALIAAEDGRLANSDIARLAAGLLFAGHETTVTRIDIGVLLLFTHPDQRGRLLADDDSAANAVEEILRLSSSSGTGLLRYARTDITIGGVTIKAGDAVLLSNAAANLDERAFVEPDRFDITRRPVTPHLAFGHGAHYCIGATLARTELRAVFSRLFQRFPTLALATPINELRRDDHTLTAAFAELPVTW